MRFFGTDREYCLRHVWKSDELMTIDHHPEDTFTEERAGEGSSTDTATVGEVKGEPGAYDESETLPICPRKKSFSKHKSSVANQISDQETDEKKDHRWNLLEIFHSYLGKPSPSVTANSSPVEDVDQSLYNFSGWRWKRKGLHDTTWLDPSPNAISTVFGAADFLSDGKIGKRLLELGVAPICQFLKKGGGVVNVMFGPMVDHSLHQPIEIGRRFPARSFYARYGLKLNDTQCDTWAKDSQRLNAIICRRPEKNHLYVPQDEGSIPFQKEDRCNAIYRDMLAEYDRIVAGQTPDGFVDNRLGFIVYGSGGNSIIAGSHAPSASATIGGNTGWFEHSQLMGKNNISITEACRDERIVVAAVSGYYFPKDRYCSELVQQLGEKTEQLAYLGPYMIRDLGYNYETQSKEDINRCARHHRQRFGSEFDTKLLRGSMCNRRAIQFVPLKIPSFWWTKEFKLQYALVAWNDPRRLMYHLPTEGGELAQVMDSVGEKSVTYTDAIERFFENKDYTHFFKPLPSIPDEEQVKPARRVVDWEVDRSVDEDCMRHTISIDPSVVWDEFNGDDGDPDQMDGGITCTLANFSKRRLSIKKMQNQMVLCSVANFARCLELNVDRIKHTIGQLVDPTDKEPDYILRRYKEAFGMATLEGMNFLSILGPALQKSPIAHPTRSYDPNRAVLIESSGILGDLSEDVISRKGVFCDVLFMAFLVEAIPAPTVFVNWTNLLQKRTGARSEDRLPTVLVPTISQVDDFIEFLRKSDKTDVGYRRMATGSYRKDGAFMKFTSAHPLIKGASTTIPRWFDETLLEIIKHARRSPTTHDLFRECVTSASKFIDNLLGQTRSKYNDFHAQHWMMNVNEIVSGFPVGLPSLVHTAFGSEFGMRLIPEACRKDPTVLFHELLSLLQRDLPLTACKARGWDKTKHGKLVVHINRRDLTTLDMEHEFCELMILVEREPGGTRSFSRNPNVQSPFHMPVPGLTLPNVHKTARRAILSYVQMVKEGYLTERIEGRQLVTSLHDSFIHKFRFSCPNSKKWSDTPSFVVTLGNTSTATQKVIAAQRVIQDHPQSALLFLWKYHQTDEKVMQWIDFYCNGSPKFPNWKGLSEYVEEESETVQIPDDPLNNDQFSVEDTDQMGFEPVCEGDDTAKKKIQIGIKDKSIEETDTDQSDKDTKPEAGGARPRETLGSLKRTTGSFSSGKEDGNVTRHEPEASIHANTISTLYRKTAIMILARLTPMGPIPAMKNIPLF